MTPAVVAAWHTRRPVRICLDRDEDMQMSGHRHAFIGKYKVSLSSLQEVPCVLDWTQSSTY